MKKITILLTALLFCFSVQAKELVLSEDNVLVLSSTFTGSSVVKLMSEAKEKDTNLKSGYPMYLFLYTPGGSIQSGLELIEYLNGLNRPVHTVTMFSASMGFQTVQHLGKRYILKYGVLMSHYARGGSRGSFGGTGMPSTKNSIDSLWARRIDLMDLKTVERTKGKQTIESYRKEYMFDLWLNGAEAVKKGYADEVVTVKCGISLAGFTERIEDFGFFRIRFKFSKCPLSTSPTKVSGLLMTNQGEMDLREFLLKNGKFGSDCYSGKYTPTSNDYRDHEEGVPADKKELCAMDKTLNLKKIMLKIQERKAHYSQDLKNNIIYSY